MSPKPSPPPQSNRFRLNPSSPHFVSPSLKTLGAFRTRNFPDFEHEYAFISNVCSSQHPSRSRMFADVYSGRLIHILEVLLGGIEFTRINVQHSFHTLGCHSDVTSALIEKKKAGVFILLLLRGKAIEILFIGRIKHCKCDPGGLKAKQLRQQGNNGRFHPQVAYVRPIQVPPNTIHYAFFLVPGDAHRAGKRATASRILQRIHLCRRRTDLNDKGVELMRKCKLDQGQADTGLHLMNKK
ncbi:hypothetical protein JOB18_038834 [Solea senegalensis]|uniref:Uncharacterized protein n=1 Tax=Solea senegalensis TaxID=28829 RepID=A0AAV6S0V2_SOLSE|nr:hypothetical protein JOB18_038834 [Solea senegalensis]